jgi:hypothetical protein
MVFNSPPEGFITSHQEGMTLQEGDIVLFRGLPLIPTMAMKTSHLLGLSMVKRYAWQ